MPPRLAEGIDWVGYVDWAIRDFHGYQTRRGSTYNAYLVRDEKVALIDTVKAPYAGHMLGQIAALTPVEKVDYIIVNHAEPDHAGALAAAVRACPNAEVVCDAKCRDTLSSYHDAAGWKWRIVKEGDRLSLGRRSLSFVEVPMVHWPESMFTYMPEEKILFPNDGFGQHYASSGRFDDEQPLDEIMCEAKSYYANILMLYGRSIARALEKASRLDIRMIAPSHGVIWRKNLGAILSAYQDWVKLKPQPKVVVMYDSIWKSTEQMAHAVAEGAMRPGVEVKLHWVRATNMTDIAADVLDAAALAFGSPTLNSGMMPQMAALLTYLEGLRPAGKAVLAFGSYGWGKGGVAKMQAHLEAMQLVGVREPIQCPYVPTAAVLGECRAAGALLADKAAAAKAALGIGR